MRGWLLAAMVTMAGSAPEQANKSGHFWTFRLVNRATHETKTFEIRQTGRISLETLACSVTITGGASTGYSLSWAMAECQLSAAGGEISTAVFRSFTSCEISQDREPSEGSMANSLGLFPRGAKSKDDVLEYEVRANCDPKAK